ncbi:MAG: DNA starvation/stationary phase protection protein Dps, partial [Kovacikia sp.]
GLDFYQLHELFDEFAGELEEYVDLVAERITALGGLAVGTARAAAQTSILPEYPFDIVDGKDHIIALADRFAPYAKHLREGIAQTDDLGDADTADLYTEVSRAIDKNLWFLEAHLQAGEPVVTTNGASPTRSAAKRTATKSTPAKTKAATSNGTSAKTPARKSRAKSK